MPIGDIAGEALGGVVRFLGRIVVEIVVELMLVGTGRLLLRMLLPRSEPGYTACGVVGLLFWAGLAVGGYWLYRHGA